MSTKLGKYYICDRCGTTLFFEKVGEGETDGGFTKFDKYEDAEGWITVYPKVSHGMRSSKLLCPACSEKYDKLMCEFFCVDSMDFNCHH